MKHSKRSRKNRPTKRHRQTKRNRPTKRNNTHLGGVFGKSTIDEAVKTLQRYYERGLEISNKPHSDRYYSIYYDFGNDQYGEYNDLFAKMRKKKEKYYPKIMNRLKNMSETRTKNQYGKLPVDGNIDIYVLYFTISKLYGVPLINDDNPIAKFIRYFQSPDSIYSNIYTRYTNVSETLKGYYRESVDIRLHGKAPAYKNNNIYGHLIEPPPPSYNQFKPPPKIFNESKYSGPPPAY